ncbi:MAG: glycosyltransferase [Lapillicoccus sp.]
MIGYYVHHRGMGHLTRMRLVTAHLSEPVTVLSTLPRPWVAAASPGTEPGWVQLPSDDAFEGADGAVSEVGDVTAGGVLHWAPALHDGLRERMARVAAWVQEERPTLVVVDVSVEIALLVRLMGVPVVLVAMRGNRRDRAHTSAYDLAEALIAAWPADVPEPGWPPSWTAKTWHVGGFSRFDRAAVRAGWAGPRLGVHPGPRGPDVEADAPPAKRRVLLVWGSGGSDIGAADVEAARAATPGWDWTVCGGPGGPGRSDVWSELRATDVVVAHAGEGVVAEVAAARVPAVVVAQARPHNEQLHTVAALTGAGLAVGLPSWPHPHQWSATLQQALDLGGDGWDRWSTGHGARGVATHLEQLVRTLERRGSAAGGGPQPLRP